MATDQKMKTIKIREDFIKLDALLKFSSIVSSGGEAKTVIAGGQVKVNGEICTMRGKKIHQGDVVSFCGQDLTVRTNEDT